MPQLDPHISPLLRDAGFQHGFFGRIGGYSCGDFATLNCSFSVGDDPSHVAQNLTCIAGHLDVAPNDLLAVSQVHGCNVLDADSLGEDSEAAAVEADALLGSRVNSALSIRTADCVPILVGCRATGMAAAIHAGWRGVVAGVVQRAIEQLQARGADAGDLIAAIGPHICEQAFEVSAEVAWKLDAVAPQAAAVNWKMGPRPHVRLASLVCAQLLSTGIPPGQIENLDRCSFTNDREFFSFRRDGKRSGRQLSVIRPRAPE